MAQWWVDPLDTVAHIRDRLDILDAFFATTGKETLQRVFGSLHGEKLFFFPNICDLCVEVGRAFEKSSPAYDLVFIGRSTPDRMALLDHLKAVCRGLVIGHFGHSPETMRFGSAYVETLKEARMGLNYSRFNDIPLYASDRLVHLAGNGLLVFSPRVPKMELLFSQEELVYYEDVGDLVEKIAYYHANEKEGQSIAQRGWMRAHRAYAAERVGQFMLETVFRKPYSEPYEWIGA
jgi:glycosyltransferase involved in cell wall biosynthesis